MKTDELARMLANQAGPCNVRRMWPGVAMAAGWGGLSALMMMVLFQGVRPDIAQAMFSLPFWVKLALPALLILGCVVGLDKITRPGAGVKHLGVWLAVPILVVWALAAFELNAAEPGEYASLIFGATWAACVSSVALLSVPVFASIFWAVQRLAPTSPVRAGACAGLLAGAVSALVYALHCPETGATFLGLWYVLGMALPTAVGALLGPRLLRW